MVFYSNYVPVSGMYMLQMTNISGPSIERYVNHITISGKDHQINSCLTTLECNGEEKLPISGLWRYMRYPFITGELMVLLAIALSTRACCKLIQRKNES